MLYLSEKTTTLLLLNKESVKAGTNHDKQKPDYD